MWQPGFDTITFTFRENSDCFQESLLDVIRQNIAGWCQQTFENKKQTFCFQKFVDDAHKQCFLSTIWIFTKGEGDGIKYRLPFKIFPTLNRLGITLAPAISTIGKRHFGTDISSACASFGSAVSSAQGIDLQLQEISARGILVPWTFRYGELTALGHLVTGKVGTMDF